MQQNDFPAAQIECDETVGDFSINHELLIDFREIIVPRVFSIAIYYHVARSRCVSHFPPDR